MLCSHELLPAADGGLEVIGELFDRVGRDLGALGGLGQAIEERDFLGGVRRGGGGGKGGEIALQIGDVLERGLENRISGGGLGSGGRLGGGGGRTVHFILEALLLGIVGVSVALGLLDGYVHVLRRQVSGDQQQAGAREASFDDSHTNTNIYGFTVKLPFFCNNEI